MLLVASVYYRKLVKKYKLASQQSTTGVSWT